MKVVVKTYKQGEKLSYRYQTSGNFRLQTSDNISSLNLVGTDETNTIQKQLRSVKAISLSVQIIESNCFRSCEKLETASFETSKITDMQPNCFSNCPKLTSVCLSRTLSQLNSAFASSCPQLSSVTFPFFESDDMLIQLSSQQTASEKLADIASGSYGLTALNDTIFYDCTALTALVIPNSISSAGQISKNALNGSSMRLISFLGLSSDAFPTDTITLEKCFGIGKDCDIETADDKLIRFADGKTQILPVPYNVDSILKPGKREKLRLGKIYRFDRDLIEWCIQENVPFITAMFDYKTSVVSRQFVENVLFDSGMTKQLKLRNFFIFMLDRHGHVFGQNTDRQDIQYYRNGYSDVVRGAIGTIDRDFISFDFVYGNNCTNVTRKLTTLDEFVEFLDDYAMKTGFNKWDPSKYKVKVDIPDDETIPSSSIDVSGIQKFGLPAWYDKGGITPGTAWTPSTESMDFKFISTPDTTYCIICAYDQNYPNDPPKGAVLGVKEIFEKHSNHVDCYYEGQSGSAQVFLNGLKKGIGYHYFMFFEFSHGANYYITLPGGVSRDDVWNAVKDARNRFIGMFDSCDSGSMIKSAKPGLFASGQQDSTIGGFLARKFKEQREDRIRRRRRLLKAGLTPESVTAAVDEDEPAIWMWSSTAMDHYGWYYPKSDTVFGAAIRSGYSSCSEKRNDEMWAATKAAGTRNVGEGMDECIPQQAVHGEDFTKNMTFT